MIVPPSRSFRRRTDPRTDTGVTPKADDIQATAQRATSPCCIVDVSLTSDSADAEARK